VAARHHSFIGLGVVLTCLIADCLWPAPQERSSVPFGIGSNINAVISDVLVSQGRTTRQPAAGCAQLPGCVETFVCGSAWEYFSSKSQRAIQIASDKKKSDPFLSHVQRRYLEPKNLYCLPTVAPFFHGYRANSVKLLTIQGTTATVAVKKGIPTGFLIPGFWPTRTRYEDHELMLVREGSKWKIAFQP
jgi:hypothetical protein